MIESIAAFIAIVAVVNGKIYFKEKFNDVAWEQRWVVPSDWKPKSELGALNGTACDFHGDVAGKGIQTSEDARFYGISAKLDAPFTNKDKQLVIQMTVKHEQDLDCGGVYIKLTGDMDQSKFSGDTPYQVMFGPDTCGPSDTKTHVTFNYPLKKENLLIKEQVSVVCDGRTRLYTLVVKPDNTFEVLIDLHPVKSGTLEQNWDFLLPKEIKDPAISKPADWVDKKKIADPEDVKPEGYDDVPKEIPDPKSQKPEDWNDEDGEWKAPMVANPDYKGAWKPKMIPNPEYKGEWVHPMIPNPDYAEDSELHVRCKDCTHIGLSVDSQQRPCVANLFVGDSFLEAEAWAYSLYNNTIVAENISITALMHCS